MQNWIRKIPSRLLLIVSLIMLMVGSVGCTRFIARVEKDTAWLVKESADGKILLHYRKPEHSHSPSPTDMVVEEIVENQAYYHENIAKVLGRSFDESLIIYLYNWDEAEDKIGTSGGGHAIPERLTYYYSYAPGYTPAEMIFHPALDKGKNPETIVNINGYIGAHEMIHIISERTIGKSGSKVMSEGYAVGIDGWHQLHRLGEVMRGKTVEDWMQEFYDDHPEEPTKILSPTELLIGGVEDSIYYPNAGYFVQYLFYTYDKEIVHQLFTLPTEEYINRFQEITGDNFTQLEENYKTYWQQRLRGSN